LYELNWEDIAELVNRESGENLGKDVFRKFWRYYNEGYEEAIKEGLDDRIIKEYENKKQDFEKEKIKYQDQKREMNNFLRIYARAEHLIEQIEKCARVVAKEKPLKVRSNINYINSSDKEGLLMLSDWHVGLEFDNYWGQYNKVIFRQRVAKLLEKTIEYGKHHQVKTLHVTILGDIISGLINVATRVLQEEDIITQTQIAAEVLAESLVWLSCEFEHIKVYSVLDNHARLTPNKTESINKENFCRLIPWYLKARLVDIDNVQIIDNKIDEDIAIINIFDEKICAVHGHRDSVGKAIGDLSLMLKDIKIDYIAMGHYHHNYENEEHGITLVINNSLSGTDEYAKNIRKTGFSAQKFLIFDKNEGRLCTYIIRLDK